MNLCHYVIEYYVCTTMNYVSVMCVCVVPILGSQGTTVKVLGAASWILPPCKADIWQQQGPGQELVRVSCRPGTLCGLT